MIGRRIFRASLAVSLAASLALALVSGCADRREQAGLCPCPDSRQLDERLMLLLSTARAYHHQADIHLQQGQVDQAITVIRQILALDLDSRWPEAEEVRLDASARLGKLILGQGRAKQALAVVDGAIKGATRQSFYLSNLHGVRGEVLEQQSRALDKVGEKDRARERARQAMAAFEKSIAINKRLLKGQPRDVNRGRP